MQCGRGGGGTLGEKWLFDNRGSISSYRVCINNWINNIISLYDELYFICANVALLFTKSLRNVQFEYNI